MKITFNMIDFEYRYNLFKQSLISSNFNLEEEIYINTICIFLGYKDYNTLQQEIKVIRKGSKMDDFIFKVRDLFTTSLISHSKEKSPLLQKHENGNIQLDPISLKKFTYQQFKNGVSKSSYYLKKNKINISQSSLLKSFSIFLGYKNWNTLSSVIKTKNINVYNIVSEDYETVIESAFLTLEDGVENVYFVDLDISQLTQQYLKNVNTLKHKYKVPFKEILKVKMIKRSEIKDSIFNGKPICFISINSETSFYIFENFIKNNKNYDLV